MANENPGFRLEKFTSKVNEIIQKGYKDGNVFDFARDIKLSRALYKVPCDVAYITVKAILSLPVFDETTNFIITLQEVLHFFKRALRSMIITHNLRIQCLRAIEDCCIQCDHLNSREVMACMIQFFLLANIVERESVLDFHEELFHKDSPFLEEMTYRVTIGYIDDGAVTIRGPGEDGQCHYWSFAPNNNQRARAGPNRPRREPKIIFVGDVDEINGHCQDFDWEDENPVEEIERPEINYYARAANADAVHNYEEEKYDEDDEDDEDAELVDYVDFEDHEDFCNYYAPNGPGL